MGNPSSATADARQRTNFLMEKRYYALSYNDDKGTPNWVSWHLSQEYLGTAPRKARFDTDTSLPSGFRRIVHNDYLRSGFDRGHLCPHSDRAFDLEMSFATFIMTNIIPQSHENNAGAWEALERYGRHLVAGGLKDLFIVSGPIGRGGTGASGARETIAGGRVVVPQSVFKVILVTVRNERAAPPEWVNDRSRLIAVIMPNDRSVPATNWGRYRTTVAEVERQTGYRFFTAAPAEIIGPKKSVADAEPIPNLPPTRRF